jgi:phage tail-like protein
VSPAVSAIQKSSEASFSMMDAAVDFNKRFQGEAMQFRVKIALAPELKGARLEVFLPTGLIYEESSADEQFATARAVVRDLLGHTLSWQLNPGSEQEDLEISIKVIAAESTRDQELTVIFKLFNARGESLEEQGIKISLKSQSNYMEFLPELFQSSDFTGRFMMLFESFWAPISQQINGIANYFDPDLTPVAFLPWLGSWIGVNWDVPLPDGRKREMLRKALGLYQRRGTKEALTEYLETYTGASVQIIEHKTRNMKLGQHSRLGHTIALGRQNKPHTFTVEMESSEDIQLLYRNIAPDKARALYQKMVEKLIDSQKPAHTAYELNLRFAGDANEKPSQKPEKDAHK